MEKSLVLDDLLNESEAKTVSDYMKNDKFWRCDWHASSKRDISQWHWHRSIWQDKPGMSGLLEKQIDEIPVVKRLWNALNEQMKIEYKQSFVPIRSYANAHTYGLDGGIHTDDGDFTAIYYPTENWDPDWEGGTILVDDSGDCIRYCRYKYNRAFIFPAKTLHKAMPITKKCDKLRTVIVFKCEIDVNHPLYVESYY